MNTKREQNEEQAGGMDSSRNSLAATPDSLRVSGRKTARDSEGIRTIQPMPSASRSALSHVRTAPDIITGEPIEFVQESLDRVEATTDWFDHFAPSFPPPQRTEVDPQRRLQEDTDDIYDTH